jgi:hypothetical protein
MVNRQIFYRSLASNGILQELPQFLTEEDYTLRMVAAEIIAYFLEHDANMLRSFILTQKKHKMTTLLEVLIKQMIGDPDEGMKFQYAEIIRQLLEWDPTDTVPVSFVLFCSSKGKFLISNI